jgi:hypothetical protein
MFNIADGLGDWRIAAASRLAKDLPAAFPGGPSHKVGTAVYQSELVQTPTGEHLGFLTPSATAMAFSIALTASNNAKRLYTSLTYDSVLTPHGRGKSISNERIGELFNFFEQCMVAVTFSFQALEVYANHTISRNLRESIEVKRGKNKVQLSPRELESQLSTDEKLSSILPRILNMPTPKGKQVWKKYKVLKDTRDATIHLKSYGLKSINESENQLLFFQFLNIDPLQYPKAAEAMVRYFQKENTPRWLSALAIT